MLRHVPDESLASSALLRRRLTATTRLDSRFSGSSVNPRFVPKLRTALFLGAVRRVLSLRNPLMSAHIANRKPDFLPSHGVIVAQFMCNGQNTIDFLRRH